jgi:hypothetical protein
MKKKIFFWVDSSYQPHTNRTLTPNIIDEEKDHPSESTTTEKDHRSESATTIDRQIAGSRSQSKISPDMEEEEYSQISTNRTSISLKERERV